MLISTLAPFQCEQCIIVYNGAFTLTVADTETDKKMAYYCRPQRSCGQGYVFTRVYDSVHIPAYGQ